ncbi:glycosyltransferase [Flavobacterium sp.]|uniref:glycosyltransferase n=1 Tax=Flavobacterium sp. TaxID=239 RepID=UPI0035292B23
MEEAKGITVCIEALRSIPIHKIEKVHFIGNGTLLDFYKQQTLFLEDKVIFHGFLESNEVHSILANSHFLLLPSKSEGFPKAVAEAACYGVVPVVSNVGSIPHYITQENGFVWDVTVKNGYVEIFQKAVTTPSESLKKCSLKCTELSKNFTFKHYLENLENQVLK